MIRLKFASIAVALFFVLPSLAVNGQLAAQKYFTDVELVDQNGTRMRLYSDLLKGHVVVINTFSATCTGACPLVNGNMEKIQEALGEKLGKDVYLISITADAAADSPAVLKAYAAKFHAKPGWHFLTGTKVNVDLALQKLGMYNAEKSANSTLIIVGNEPTGLWKKAFGLANAEDLIKVVESVVNDRAAP